MNRPPREDQAAPARPARALTLLTFFVGAGLSSVFVGSIGPWVGVPIVAAALTAIDSLRGAARSERRGRRVAGIAAWTVVILAYCLWSYLAFAWGSMLFWSVPPWGWALVLATAAAALLTSLRPVRGFRLAPALPLGLWIGLCVLGWNVEEGRIHCDDYTAATGDPDIRLVSPTTHGLARCGEGEVRSIGRYPRIVWEPSSGDRLLVTTQARGGGAPPAGALFRGSVCEVRPGVDPRCIGDAGKAQGIVESASLDRIFIAGWGDLGAGVRGRVVAIPRDGPLETIAELSVASHLGDFVYDPTADRLYGFTDDGYEIVPIVASTLTAEATVPAPLVGPGATRYDTARGEGLLCVGGGPVLRIDGSYYMAIAISGDPLAIRPLGGSSPLSALALSWGCDWDPARRQVYAALPNLGLLATIDYDSGDVQRLDYVGFGMRSVTLDIPRHRIYLTSFLGGYVFAVDLRTGEEVDRWFVGRFPRMATLARDGGTLWVGTNLGVVAIAL